ncbi:MAG: L-threonylcarbamoyladenylate synthase, partial [bacterium]|nr:L-threonylcarbamoyladenylate synthase [bacterium]
PGPLTLVFAAADNLPKNLVGADKTIGVRIPDHRICRELIRLCGVPITSTSANLAGGKNPTSAGEVVANFGKRLQLIIDGGAAKSDAASTVISVVSGKIRLLREGIIKKSQLETITGRLYE